MFVLLIIFFLHLTSALLLRTKFMALSRPVYIVAARRTAFGAFGGKLRDVTATELGKKTTIAVLEDANLDPCHVKSVIFGNVIQVRNMSEITEVATVFILSILHLCQYYQFDICIHCSC